MSTSCDRSFDESLLSGYLDRMLTQGDRQRVETHVADCPSCREVLHELREIRGAALDTELPIPRDEQWRELPRTRRSALFRTLGWVLVLAWLLGVTGWGLWELVRSSEPVWEKVLVLGGIGGGGILLVSVLLDRLHDLRTDPYRGVLK